MNQREMKFRAWDDDHFEMLHIGDRLMNFRGYAVMQFTGLMDKNGKEIYEGDILNRLDRVGAVRWDDSGSWACDWNDVAWNWRLPAFSGSELEVVGNIYENPEILPHEKVEINLNHQ